MIRVIQLNCARSYQWTIVALETAVKRRADRVCVLDPPREKGGIGISHGPSKITTRKRVWTARWKGSGLVVDERTDYSRGANDDVLLRTSAGEGRQ